MTETWGLTGPQFLVLYLAGLVVSILVAVLAHRQVRRAGPATTTGRLSPDDIAYLAGGGGQVVLAAVARMLERGMLRAARDGTITVTQVLPQHPLDREIAAHLHRTGSGTSRLRWLRDRFQHHKLVNQVRNRLVSLGLVVSQRQQRTARLTGAFVFGLLFVIGVARYSAGQAAGKPTGYLTALLTINVLLIGLALWIRGGRLTESGRRTLATIRPRIGHEPAASADGLVLVGSSAAFLVAVGGVAAFPDEEVSKALAMHTPGSGGWFSGSSSNSGSSSSTNCSSSSSSCSSASSCSSGSSGGGGGGCGG